MSGLLINGMKFQDLNDNEVFKPNTKSILIGEKSPSHDEMLQTLGELSERLNSSEGVFQGEKTVQEEVKKTVLTLVSSRDLDNK